MRGKKLTLLGMLTKWNCYKFTSMSDIFWNGLSFGKIKY